jgi:hypothetical protein
VRSTAYLPLLRWLRRTRRSPARKTRQPIPTQGVYIDRSIVYYRMGDLKRAFADVSQAKRIDDSNRSKASPTAVGTR